MGGSASKSTSTTTSQAKTTPDIVEEKMVTTHAHTNGKAQKAIFEGTSDLTTIGLDRVEQWEQDLADDPTLALAQLVLSRADPVASLTTRQPTIDDVKVFNINLKGTGAKGEYPGPRVNQKASGRCWLFATTNVLRYNVIEQLKLGEFQLSQAYLFFWDKLEKANYFLENVLELVDEPIEGRLMSFLRTDPVGDGGQWDMAYNILEKYGAIPVELYPESFSSGASRRLNSIVTSKLREYALVLRQTVKKDSITEARKLKTRFMNEIYNTLAISMGTPPKPDQQLTWEYYNADNKFNSWKGSPKDFYAQFCRRKNMDPKDSFSLINDPRNQYEKAYTVKRLGNVWGGRKVKYVNADFSVLEDAIIAGIKANTPLFFGCDSGRSSSPDATSGIWDEHIINYKAAYGFDLNMNKAERLLSGESAATHAMVITAVHVNEQGRPVKYKIENSWGDERGEKGWYMATAEWFRESVFQVVVPRSLVDKKWVAIFDGEEATELEPWDPMGVLA